MTKIFDFIREHCFYIVLNIFLATLTAAVLFIQPLSAIGFMVLALVIYGWWLVIPVLVFLNWISYKMVYNDELSSVKLAALGGFLGAFIAAHTVNKKFEYAVLLDVIFNIYIWIILIYPVCVGILFLTGVYNLL